MSYSRWRACADLVGIIPAESLDKIPSYRQEWMDTSTMKTTEQMKDAKSIIVTGYHASDDIYEAIIRKGNRIDLCGYPTNINDLRLLQFLLAKGFKAEIADIGLTLRSASLIHMVLMIGLA
ncbi:MAG: hypothetical protein NTY03_04370 [Candidatus Bathyarchaeota archaeon]|nr:hypothetical protein [Candidatus Bathyarchaeota archaeon]